MKSELYPSMSAMIGSKKIFFQSNSSTIKLEKSIKINAILQLIFHRLSHIKEEEKNWWLIGAHQLVRWTIHPKIGLLTAIDLVYPVSAPFLAIFKNIFFSKLVSFINTSIQIEIYKMLYCTTVNSYHSGDSSSMKKVWITVSKFAWCVLGK